MDDSLLTWEQVLLVHRSPRRAVNIAEGLVRSALCGGRGQHSDHITYWEVKYSLPRRAFYEHVVKAFERTLAAASPVQVFEKMRQNEWLFLGEFKVSDVSSGPRVHEVTMTRVGPEALAEPDHQPVPTSDLPRAAK